MSVVEGVRCKYIKKAFEMACNNITPMSIREFIAVTEFPVDAYMVDHFFHNMNESRSIDTSPSALCSNSLSGTPP